MLFGTSQLVVANLLERRKEEVVIVGREKETVLRVTEKEKEGTDDAIERKIVSHICSQHAEYLQ